MDFFAHQDSARARSKWLVALLCFNVLVVALAIYSVLMIGRSRIETGDAVVAWWDPRLLAICIGGTFAVVFAGSAYKMQSLLSGGAVVAEGLGGRVLHRDTTEPDDRQLLNIVDEMAIASGVPVPPVYVMEDERSVNAFAAGNSPSDAVIGVTRGCIEALNRDQMQGVIAHEFSHILNGDMRLNIRLIGILHGVLVIGLAGRLILQSQRGSRYRRRNKEGGGILALGLVLFVVGYTGLLIGRLLRAAVSRQREFLADASAVQFTRNPDGIAGALEQIGSGESGSRISSSNAAEASHLFFGDALKSSFFGAFATHPPIDERVRRIRNLPADETRGKGTVAFASSGDFGGEQLHSGFAASAAPVETGGADWDHEESFQASATLESVGNFGESALDQAHRIEESLPARIDELTRTAYGARAVIYGLLLDREADVCDHQLEILQQQADPAVVAEVQQIVTLCHDLPVGSRIPVVELSMPSLRELSHSQLEIFLKNVDALIKADSHVHLFEYLLRRLVVHCLPDSGRKRNRGRQRQQDIEAASADLVGALAVIGSATKGEATAACDHALQQAGLRNSGDDEVTVSDLKYSKVDRSLAYLARANLTQRRKVLQACMMCVEHDGVTTAEELQVLRVIAVVLDCPLPLAGMAV